MNQTWKKQKTPHTSPLTGELWDVCWEDIGENWPRYNGTALYSGIAPKGYKLYELSWYRYRFNISKISLAS